MCDGTGKSEIGVGAFTIHGADCDRCNGKGIVEPMTNEEYLKSCDTEQLAKEIYRFVWCCNELWQQLCCNGDGTDEESDLRIVRKWLKQPHSGE